MGLVDRLEDFKDSDGAYFTSYLSLHPPPPARVKSEVTDSVPKPLENNNTIVIRNLPSKWFGMDHNRFGRGLYEPKTSSLRLLFSQFGRVVGITIQQTTTGQGQSQASIDQSNHYLGPLFDAIARYASHEEAMHAMEHFTQLTPYLSSVTNAKLVVRLEVEADSEGKLLMGSSHCKKSSPTSSSGRPKQAATNDDNDAGGGNQQDVLLRQNMEDTRFELDARIQLLRQAVQSQTLALQDGLRNNDKSPSVASDADDRSSTTRSLCSSNSKTSSQHAELANSLIAEALHHAQVTVQAASNILQECLGPNVILTSSTDLKQRVRSARCAIKIGEESLEALEHHVHKTIVGQYKARLTAPSLRDFLIKEGHGLFLECLRRRPQALTVKSAGITILVPRDEAFLGEINTFESDCWRMHVIEGIYTLADMSHRKEMLTISNQPDDAIRCHKDPLLGVYVIYRRKEDQPTLHAIVSQADVLCTPKLMVHVVDRILFPA